MNNESNLQTNFSWLTKTWFNLKQEAQKTHDWSTYIYFLKELQKEFSKLYASMTNEKWLDLIENVLKIASCELKESIIKYNNKAMPEDKNKKKMLQEMTDKELVDIYLKGTQWLRENEQVTNTTKTKSGKEYNDQMWQAALNKLEKIEIEMNKRSIAI